MKKFFVLIFVLTMVLSLCACGKDNVQPTTPNSAPNSTDKKPTETNPTVPPTEHIHSYTVEQVAPTCTKNGSITHICICGDIHTTPIPANGHIFGNWIVTVKPSMTTTGQAKHICTVCEFEEIKDLPANTLEQEIQSFMNDLLFCMPEFKSVDALSGGMVFNWASWHIPKVSWEMDDNYLITIVYSIDELDAFSQKYLGNVFDYTYLAESHKDYMTFDMEKREITVLTGGAGGGGYNYTIHQLTENGSDQYIVQYLAVDPYVEDAMTQGLYYYGKLEFIVVGDHLQILSHIREDN